MNMKNCILAIIMIASFSSPVLAQDSNDELGRLTDVKFNQSENAVYVNGKFIKSIIGLNIERSNDDMSISKESCSPFTINGVTYKGKTNITMAQEPEFVSLEDIRKQYCPNVSGPVVYMINKFFITNDAESYRIEKNFVKHCEILSSSEIEVLKGQRPFTIVRVFLKTKANSYPVRLN